MSVTCRELVVPALCAIALLPSGASAEGNCTTLDVDFMPAVQVANPLDLRFDPQIVAWIEKPDGTFVDTAFITQETGTFGLGNRPGRFDFNSGPAWPYGRRITVFPVWAHRHGLSWGEVVFQNGGDNDLSHPFSESSREGHYCRPLEPDGPDKTQWDARTCATTVFTDKGVLATAKQNLYPPRNDVIRSNPDDPVVDMFALLNGFDAVSTATPQSGTPATLSYAVPENLPFGDYVLFVEVSREFDQNTTYDFPSPTLQSFGGYGIAYRGQPSLVYRLPFSIVDGTETTATALDYFGYGDPDGLDGNVRTPDNTITTDVPGSGASRLQVLANGGTPYRLRLISRPQIDLDPPAAAGNAQITGLTGNSATVAFVAPGDDGTTDGRVKSYEIRYLVGQDITPENFAAGTLVTASVVPVDAGGVQTFTLDGLLPETAYSIGIRAIDDCRNLGDLAVLSFSTPERDVGQVDACFVATAAYGSVLAADVDLLRRFRDSLMRKTVLGELAVETYYTFGPSLSGVVGESDLLRATARDLLAPIVDRVRGVRIEPPASARR